MKIRTLLATTVAILGISAAPALAQITLFILGPQGEFLGRVGVDGQNCSRYDSDCIWNPYSDFGSRYSEFSIFNDYSEYGSSYGSASICNMNISYDESARLFVSEDNSIYLADVIGPASESRIGASLYAMACLAP